MAAICWASSSSSNSGGSSGRSGPPPGGRFGARPLGPVDLDIGQPELAHTVLELLLGLTQASFQSRDEATQGIDGQTGLGEQRRLLGEVDGGQLEESVAVIGHHHLDWGVDQLGPHGRHLLGQCLFILRVLGGPDVPACPPARGWTTRSGGLVPCIGGSADRAFAIRCPK